jgi:hypothetical protein
VWSGLVKLPLAVRPWALPIWVAWYRSPEGDQTPGTRHRTPAPLARLLVARLRRWFPARQFVLVGDTGYGTGATARFCRKPRRQRTWVSTCYGEAALSDPPPPRTRRTLGRPRVNGQQLASPPEVVVTTSERARLTVAWSGGRTRASEVVTGTGHWYRIGEDLGAGRWVYVHAGTAPHRDAYCFTTEITMKPPQIVA